MEFTELKTVPVANPARSKRVWRALWFFAVLCIGVGYYLVPVPLKQSAKTARTLAQVVEYSGLVFVQSAGESAWTRAVKGQAIGNGDRISTGAEASVRVSFGDGRILALGPESVIEPSGIVRADGEVSFDVKLIRGAIKAVVSTKCRECSPISVRSESESFPLEKGKVLGLFKPMGGNTVKFDPRGPWPKALVSGSFRQQLSSGVVAAIQRRSTTEGVATLSNVANQRVWWTLKPMVALNRDQLNFKVGAPSQSFEQWQPMLYLSGPGGRGVRRTMPVQPNGDLELPLGNVSLAARRAIGEGFRTYKFSLRPGGRYIEGRARRSVVDETVQDFEIRTFGENFAGPLVIGLDRIVPVDFSGPLFWPKDELQLAEAPVVIKLASSRDVESLESVIRGSTAMATQTRVALSNGGTFALRSEKVVAELSGGALNDRNIEILANVLSASIVFEGERDALVPMGAGNANFLAYRVAQLRRRAPVQLLKPNGDLVALTEQEYPTPSDLAAVINEGAVGLFRSPVKIQYFAEN